MPRPHREAHTDTDSFFFVNVDAAELAQASTRQGAKPQMPSMASDDFGEDSFVFR